jgi:hypothetical protein
MVKMKPKINTNNNVWRSILAIALGYFLVGCGGMRHGDPKAAIQQAIEQHLAGRPGLAGEQIVMELKQVQVQGDTAQADVVFRSRNDPKAQMSFHYQLHNDGKEWKVDNGHPGGDASPHSSMTPPSGSAPALPEGHPPIQ